MEDGQIVNLMNLPICFLCRQRIFEFHAIYKNKHVHIKCIQDIVMQQDKKCLPQNE